MSTHNYNDINLYPTFYSHSIHHLFILLLFNFPPIFCSFKPQNYNVDVNRFSFLISLLLSPFSTLLFRIWFPLLFSICNRILPLTVCVTVFPTYCSFFSSIILFFAIFPDAQNPFSITPSIIIHLLRIYQFIPIYFWLFAYLFWVYLCLY